MSIDDRLTRLTERHEALTHTVEIIAHQISQMGTRIEQLTANSERDSENIRALAPIAEIHEHRLSDLEGEA